jgi:hypothetical protein
MIRTVRRFFREAPVVVLISTGIAFGFALIIFCGVLIQKH